MNKKNLYGYWQLESLRFMNIDKWEDEEPISGTAVFAEAGFMNLYTNTNQFAFGVFGRFFVEEENVCINVDFCTAPDMKENKLILSIASLTNETLILNMIDDATGLTFESHFKLITRTFSHEQKNL